MSFAGTGLRRDRQGADRPPQLRRRAMFIFKRSALGVLVALSIAAMPALMAL
jgi:hypothetical protein